MISWEAGDWAMTEQAAAGRQETRKAGDGAVSLLLPAMQFAVFERKGLDRYVAVSAFPDWFHRVKTLSTGTGSLSLAAHFPSLEGFMPVAEEFWGSGSTHRLQSDFWKEKDDEGGDVHLLAIAVTVSARHFLAIERADATYVNHQQLQIYAREMVSQYQTITRLNSEVERANEAKSEFLATMSHEIRTPLNAILGMADLLAETTLDAEQRNYVEVFQRAGGTLLGLINDILDLSKVEAGYLELESVDFDLEEVIGRVLELARVKASAKGLEVGVVLADGLPRILVGDPLRLRQILINLLGNAVKFTETGSLEIQVSQDPEDSGAGALLFRVKDTGIGIAADKLTRVFDNFSQADYSTTRKYGGTGLGLAISRRLVELMGGKIWVESEPGVGSIFFFTVKLGVGYLAAGAADERDEGYPFRVQSRMDGQPPVAHILLADDSEDNRFLILEYLKRSPYVVDVAENGASALGMMKRHHYDLVLMDAHMPVMDGYAATRAMRDWEKEQGWSPVPIVALTADAFSRARDQGKAAGCDAMLTKPLGKGVLMDAIRRFALACDRPVQSAAPVQDGIEPLLESLTPRYLKNMEKELAELRASEAREDFENIQRIGHNLHGTGQSFGFPRITEFGNMLEQAAKERSIQTIRGTLSEFGLYLDQSPVAPG